MQCLGSCWSGVFGPCRSSGVLASLLVRMCPSRTVGWTSGRIRPGCPRIVFFEVFRLPVGDGDDAVLLLDEEGLWLEVEVFELEVEEFDLEDGFPRCGIV